MKNPTTPEETTMEKPTVRNGWLILEHSMLNLSSLDSITRAPDGSAMMGGGNLRGTVVAYEDVQRALVEAPHFVEEDARERFAEELIDGLEDDGSGHPRPIIDYIRSKI